MHEVGDVQAARCPGCWDPPQFTAYAASPGLKPVAGGVPTGMCVLVLLASENTFPAVF